MTTSKLLLGVVAGLIGGLVFGMMMQMMTAPTPDGGHIPMLQMVAMVVRSDNVLVGWLYHLFNSAVIGALFGWLLGSRIQNYGSGLVVGAVYGFAWWILGGLIIMPFLLGLPIFAPVLVSAMLPVGIGSLIGHLIYGVILGGVFVWLSSRARQPMTQATR